MKKIIVLMMAVLVLVLMVMPGSAMINGELDTEHPNVGAIVFHWELYPEHEYLRACTGTLIHERVLLTAAHCPNMLENGGITYDQMWVTFNQDALSDEATYYGVDNIITHPDFNPGSQKHDLAMVFLEQPVPDLIPEPLPEEGYLDVILANFKGDQESSINFNIIGYGATGDWELPERHLDGVRRVGSVTFQSLTPLEILAKWRQNDAVVCYGDSGGPMFYLPKNGNDVMVGIHAGSSGTAPCEQEYDLGLTFKYRLDTPDAQEFINANLPD